MRSSQNKPGAEEDLRQAKVRPKKRGFQFVWIVPVAAAVVAGYLIYQQMRQFGPEITIRFKNATGLKAGQTQIEYLGVKLGEVTGVELGSDEQSALVKGHLRRSVQFIAREGSIFWIVRPEVGIASITGLGTIVAGPHIEVLPGPGMPKLKFEGMDVAPVGVERDGLRIILLSRRLEASKTGSPVYYRGVEVGTVSSCELSTNALLVETHVFIKRRYANLVRTGSKFWNINGIEARFGLFRGLHLDVESLKSLVISGVAFATPDDVNGVTATNGSTFVLNEESKKEWSDWDPQISILPAELSK
jgi:paraquat-inducible protein B